MKKKFLIFTLCFTLIFSSINYKKSYADGGVISLPILATVGSLAVASGIVIKNNDDLYDIGRMFYEYVNNQNDLTWDVITTTFNSAVGVLNNGLVSVDSKFLNIVKGFFDDVFSNTSNNILLTNSLSLYPSFNIINIPSDKDNFTYKLGDLIFDFSYVGLNTTLNKDTYKVIITAPNGAFTELKNVIGYHGGRIYIWTNAISDRTINLKYGEHPSSKYDYSTSGPLPKGYVISESLTFPYSGGYTWDNVENKKEDESIALPIPGDLGQLVGQGSKDFWDNTDGLVGGGDLSIPNVDSPSIPLDGTVSFPNVGDIPSDTPSDTPFANITDYIIGLVVPSDSYWTDTFGGLHTNFINSFPMVDMSGFNSLIVNGKPFPNIDVKIMGVNGRVVNGDTVNSIVSWLRPIIAGFIFLCLMFFNYRKLYKLIRNSEPFEGIGKVENHAN